ncbi:MAG: hypothetical protein J4G16_06975 [Acidobacteria bacterium]|nr:hypothetical protein [Acidobacteriota bacterium]
MHDRRAGHRLSFALLLLLGAGAGPASADLTVFAGHATPDRVTRGAALGISLRPVGLEFEYAGMPSAGSDSDPARQTGLFNLVFGAPLDRHRRLALYGAVGGGLYRDRTGTHARTNLAAGAGAGVNISLRGPLRLRIDYRLLVLRGARVDRRPRRVYVGLNLPF